MSYTPGPWKYDISLDGTVGVTMDHAHQVGWDLEGACPECFGNMRLIAAAPDLLEALKAVADSITPDALDDGLYWLTKGTIAKIRVALIRARG